MGHLRLERCSLLFIPTWTPPVSTQRRLAAHRVLFTDSLYTLSNNFQIEWSYTTVILL